MEISYIIAIVAILIIVLVIFYFKNKQSYTDTRPIVNGTHKTQPKVSAEPVAKDWNDVISDISLDPGVKESHAAYNANVRQFSSGANFSAVSDDNTSPIFTNFIGFSRPQYVEIDSTARQIPDIDTTVLKRNKRLTFKNDYDL